MNDTVINDNEKEILLNLFYFYINMLGIKLDEGYDKEFIELYYKLGGN
jgi:hypothetical protein